MRGGYKLINFKHVPLTTGTEATIAGVYEAIESNYRKRTVITGLDLDGAELADVETLFAVDGTDFVGTIFVGDVQKTVTVADDDGVTIADIPEPEET